jgi:CXXX repeat modification system protein
MKEVVGKVTPTESGEIKKLFTRKNALMDLLKSVEKGTAFYENAMEDFIETNEKFQNWWNITAKKYSWKDNGTTRWEINFDTCEIFIVNNS